MTQHFVNRKKELNFLNNSHKKNASQLIVIYGRRRVGKTELLKKFISKHKHSYFLCEKSSISKNIQKLSEILDEYLKGDLLSKSNIDDFEDFFKLFLNLKKNKEKLVIVLDEFPYLIELNNSITSIFQKIWDNHLKNRKDITLVLMGSSISMMETEVLGYKSPLYGRRTAQWKVAELEISCLKEFLPKTKFEDILYSYSIFGGIPLYLQLFDESKNIIKNISNLFLWKGGFLYEEAENILKQEFREPKNYKLILQAICEGKRKSGEIANTTGIDKTAISRYMEILESLSITGYELPLLAVPRSKHRHYFIKDNYFNFWFKFISPLKTKIEEGKEKDVLHRIKKGLNTYFGAIFEDICTKAFYKKNLFEFDKIGRQWGKTKTGTYEIDIVGINENKKEILFAECKWQNKVDAKKILSELKEKTKHINWNNETRKETFAIFAKSFKTKDVKGVKLYDLKDLEKIFF